MIITPLEKLELQNLKPEKVLNGKDYRRNNRWIETLRDFLPEPCERDGQGDGEGRPGLDHRPERTNTGPDQELIPRTHPGQELLAQTSGYPRGRPIHSGPLGSGEGTTMPASSVSDQRRTEGPDQVHEGTDPFRSKDSRVRTETATEGKPREVENQSRPKRELQPGRVPQALYPDRPSEPGSTGRGTNGPIDILI